MLYLLLVYTVLFCFWINCNSGTFYPILSICRNHHLFIFFEIFMIVSFNFPLCSLAWNHSLVITPPETQSLISVPMVSFGPYVWGCTAPLCWVPLSNNRGRALWTFEWCHICGGVALLTSIYSIIQWLSLPLMFSRKNKRKRWHFCFLFFNVTNN